MSEPISKGIFWFICGFNEMDECDFLETEMIAFPVPWGRDGNVTGDWNYNHKKTWTSLVKHRKDLRKYGWNYFPRGRVEISGGRAFLYVNINIIRYENFKRDIIDRFHLDGVAVRVIVDNSRHYYCHEDDKSIQ